MQLKNRAIDVSCYPRLITEEGDIIFSSKSNGLDVNVLPDGSIEGLTELSTEIIKKLNINSVDEIKYRNNFKDLNILTKKLNNEEVKIYSYFSSAIRNIATINRAAETTKEMIRQKTRHLLYAGVFSALEALLQDYLKYSVEKNDIVLKGIVLNENLTEFHKNNKMTIADLVKDNKTPRERVIEILNTLIYHNFHKTRSYYEAAFSITFPSIERLEKSVQIRHIVVHRNGIKKGEESPCELRLDEVRSLILDVQTFVIELLTQLTASKT
ncbi:MAG: hypothetical protein ACRBCS_12625 [Cellvibrionaceae bacterium]